MEIYIHLHHRDGWKQWLDTSSQMWSKSREYVEFIPRETTKGSTRSWERKSLLTWRKRKSRESNLWWIRLSCHRGRSHWAGFKKVIQFQCDRCKDVKAIPYQSLNKFNKVSQTNTCSECTKTRSDQVKKCTEQNMCSCVCGITYYCSSDRAMVLHEQSDRHKKALRRNRLIEGKRYKRDELRLLCRTNSIPYYNSLKVEDMIDKLLSLEDITIPEL